MLEAMKDQFGFRVKEITEQILNNIIISSTKIRQAIVSGNIEEANNFLGYSYFFEGKVVEGNKLGRTIGYPTANLEINNTDKLVPGDGVYAVTLDAIKILADQTTNLQLFGMMNIGIRPTIGGTRRVIEVNIFDFNEEIYGRNLTVYLHKRLRGEVKFNGLDALKAQLAIDKAQAVAALKEL